MQYVVIVVFLAILIGLFAPPVQEGLKRWVHKDSRRVFLVPAALTAFFAAALAARDAASPSFLLMVAAYTFVPTAIVYRNERGGKRGWLDLLAVLLLWLPLEFATGKELLPQQAWSIANHLARGTAITLALFLFLIFRRLPGMKYNMPRSWRDLANPAIGFAAALPVFLLVGSALAFIGPFRVPPNAGAAFARIFPLTLVGVAIPEELLFRSLVQNRLMQMFGFSNRVLLLAAVIFGAAHLDNGPQPLPNWRYMILATIAGVVYGKVFQKSSTVLSSAALHAFVNTIRHIFFA